MYKQFLQKIHKPLLFHLHQEQEEHESNGADFADWLISNVDIEKGPGEGRKLYNKILAAGRTSLEELLSSYPPLWMELQQVPQLAGQFIEDFLHRDEIRKDQTAFEEQEAEDEDEDDELVEENLPIGGDDGRYSGGHSGGADAESLGSPANGKAAGAGAAATAAGATLVQEEPASGAGKRRRGTGHQPIQPIRET